MIISSKKCRWGHIELNTVSQHCDYIFDFIYIYISKLKANCNTQDAQNVYTTKFT